MNKEKQNDKQSNHGEPAIGQDSSAEELEEALEASPLLSHLIELRERIFKSLLVTCVVFVALFYFANDIYQLLSLPLQAQLPEGSTMIATGIVSPFLAPFKLTLVVSLFIAMPFILYQTWRFIAPGLYHYEKRLAFPLLFLSVSLFYGGMAFAYFVVFPLVMGFLMNVGPANVQVMPDINEYLAIALKLLFAFGMAFQIPIATTLLVWSGAMDVATLKEKRAYVLVGCFVFGMLLTPPDVISQILLAVPMYILFELGIVLSRLPVRRKPRGIKANK